MSHSNIQILLAQFNASVGNVVENSQRILDTITQHHQQFDLIVFPELALCGYPPADLLYQPDFLAEIDSHLQTIIAYPSKAKIVLGLPRLNNGSLFNALAFIDGKKVRFYDKRSLPNYSVFNESRYFTEGTTPFITFEIKEHRFGLLICEDIWQQTPVAGLLQHHIDSIICINASPYHQGKHLQRYEILKSIPKNIIYLNMVGGQDEIVFDGQSMVINAQGDVCAKAPGFKEALLPITLKNQQWSGPIAPALATIEELYQALQLGLSDFMRKNSISKVVLGLSGGIDSALTLAIASQALGPKKVHVLLMPSEYTAAMSIEDAIAQAEKLGVSYDILPIDNHVEMFQKQLTQSLGEAPNSIGAQNIQARIRGMLLMAYANQHQALLLSTSNKSESAVGYCTLYGDMCGGFAVIKDVYKTQVYQLAEHVNREDVIIPKRVITRPPTAELAPNQTDQDALPPYDVLDAILIDFVENRLSEKALLAKGFSQTLVQEIYQKIKCSEFKRFQAAPGTKVSSVAFGKDWCFPISNAWKV